MATLYSGDFPKGPEEVKIGYIICEALCKVKAQAPCSNIKTLKR